MQRRPHRSAADSQTKAATLQRLQTKGEVMGRIIIERGKTKFSTMKGNYESYCRICGWHWILHDDDGCCPKQHAKWHKENA